MTPEARAQNAEDGCDHTEPWTGGTCLACFTDAIRAAVAEEREAIIAMLRAMLDAGDEPLKHSAACGCNAAAPNNPASSR